jgi:pSer/pThr/pTyr-binding forkhead associated (FHA) protein
MALTVVIVCAPGVAPSSSEDDERDEAFTITFDAPRVVIGRGEGCEVRIPDPTVSLRHATIQQRGPEYLVVDEGSENGTFIDHVKLAPRSPRVLRPGEHVRVGRVWLRLDVELAMPNGTPSRALAMALELTRRALADDGEDVRPRVRVTAGPDEGREVRLDPGQACMVGRAREAGLQLTDAAAGRRHVELCAHGDVVKVRDLGSDAGARLGDAPLEGEKVWRPGTALTLGATTLSLEHEAVRALAEISRGPGVRMRAEDVPELPGAPDEEEPEVVEAPSDVGAELTPAPSLATPVEATPLAKDKPRHKVVWGVFDVAVLLIALGVLSLSAGGFVLLMRGV